MNRFFTFLLSFFLAISAWATHNRAGEITYTWLGGRTYEVVITTYTKESVVADRCDLTLSWGDNSSSILYRENGPSNNCPPPAHDGETLGGDIQKNVYRGQHTYQAPGFYTLSFSDQNRNEGIDNIPNSVLVPFTVSSLLNVNPALGTNSSPILLNPPIDKGCVNQTFIHNPGAWDPDGDSLGYELVNCRGLNGVEILQTYDPSVVQDPVTIDPITGDFIWDVPKNQGQFNFAIEITEYRKGPNGLMQVVGQVVRDMQIDIEQCNNQPPVINPVGPFCVLVGENLNFTVSATDPDNNSISLTANGGPLEVNPKAQFPQPTNGVGAVQQNFNWTPACNQVQKNPWTMYFRVEDKPSNTSDPPLVDYMSVDITVIAPAPENLEAVPNIQGEIDLNWNASICTEAVGYHIYRKEGFYGYTPDSCETGVPEYTGYEYLASTNNWADTTFVDGDNLNRGMEYCYMVTAYFDDEAESQASNEACTELIRTTPIITHVDVIETDAAAGKIEIKWVKPQVLDTFSFPPPYKYSLERAEDIDGTNFVEVAQFTALTDTFYSDENIDTETRGYSYRVVLYSGQNEVEVGASDVASSVFVSLFPFDMENRLRFNFNVPWQNQEFVVYKETAPGSGVFNIIDTTTNEFYNDTGLINNQVYCYKVLAIGNYTGDSLPSPLLNHSQEICGTPLDTTPPCSPEMEADVDCENGKIVLRWSNPSGEFCSDDILFYNIYYKPTSQSPWPAVPLVSGLDPATFEYTYESNSIVGCYVVTAVDDANPANESVIKQQICVDGCPVIQLPNVFTPNGSPPNNFFRPVRDENGNPKFNDIEKFDMQIFNRWGNLVYQSQDETQFVEFGWDGRDRSTGQPVSDGVYFYIFTYTPRSVNDVQEKVLNGTVTLLR